MTCLSRTLLRLPCIVISGGSLPSPHLAVCRPSRRPTYTLRRHSRSVTSAAVATGDVEGEPEDGLEASDIRGSSTSSSSSNSSSSSSSSSRSSSTSSSTSQLGDSLPRPKDSESGHTLTLVLPANLRLGYYSAYPELTGLMFRAPLLSAMHRAEECPAAATLGRLRIGPLLGAGRTWTVYGATADAGTAEPTSLALARLCSSSSSSPSSSSSSPSPPTSSPASSSQPEPMPRYPSDLGAAPDPEPAPDTSFPPLVVKLFSPDISPFPRARPSPSPSPSSTQLATEARENMLAALSEADMYAGPLRRLQGVAVPRYYGLWGGADEEGRWLYALVLERVGRAIHRRRDGAKGTWEGLLPQQRRAVAELYSRVHEAGIVHGDIELRHLRRELDGEERGGAGRRDGGGGLRLIDFEGAKDCSRKPGAVEKERRQLDKCIGPEWRRWLGVPGP